MAVVVAVLMLLLSILDEHSSPDRDDNDEFDKTFIKSILLYSSLVVVVSLVSLDSVFSYLLINVSLIYKSQSTNFSIFPADIFNLKSFSIGDGYERKHFLSFGLICFLSFSNSISNIFLLSSSDVPPFFIIFLPSSNGFGAIGLNFFAIVFIFSFKAAAASADATAVSDEDDVEDLKLKKNFFLPILNLKRSFLFLYTSSPHPRPPAKTKKNSNINNNNNTHFVAT